MVRLPRIAFVLLLASTLAPSLAGCGVTPGTSTATSTTAQAATNRPQVPGIDMTALAKVKSGLSASDFGTVSQAKNTASNALYQYNDLRNQWQSTWDDNQKDNIEQEMLNVLTQADSSIRGYTNNGCCDNDNQQLFQISNNSLQQYNYLRNEWMGAYDVNQKRQLVNQMLVDLTQALQQINNYQSYNPNPYPNPYNPQPYNPYNPYNPYTH